MMLSFSTSNEAETKNAARLLGALVEDGDVITLSGELGVGKTQFAQGVAQGMQITSDILSPTFNIVFTYQDGSILLNHFDLYRLDDASELEDIGFHEMVDEYTPGACLIEWADKFLEEMPDDRLDVNIYRSILSEEPNMRTIEVDPKGPRSERLMQDWQSSLKAIGL